MRRKVPGGLCLLLFAFLVPWVLLGNAQERFQLETFAGRSSFYDRWQVKRWAGTVRLDFLADGDTPYLQLTCPSSSWAFYRRLDVDLARTPVLTWAWKADVLPTGGDGRKRVTDDEAGQVYILFRGRGLLGALTERILVYTWETVPPRGLIYTPQRNAETRVFVLRNQEDDLGSWKRESRDVARDFRLAFGEDPPKPIGVSFQIDSDDTRSEAQCAFADLAFTAR